MLLHATDKKLLKIKNKKQTDTYKPRGLWYASGTDWLKWAIDEDYKNTYKYFYKLKMNYTDIDNVDKNSVLKLDNRRDYVKFIREYELGADPGFETIDWKRVAKDYAGLELIPYEDYMKSFMDKEMASELGLEHAPIMWSSGWDVASGCVWRVTGIKSVSRIRTRRE